MSPGAVRTYPNPTTGNVSFALDLPKLAGSGAQIRIYDATGSLVKRLAVDARDKAGAITWDGMDEAHKNVAAGVYYYNVRTKSGMSSEGKVVVAR